MVTIHFSPARFFDGLTLPHQPLVIHYRPKMSLRCLRLGIALWAHVG